MITTIVSAKIIVDNIDKKIDFALINYLRNIHNISIKCGQVKVKNGVKNKWGLLRLFLVLNYFIIYF